MGELGKYCAECLLSLRGNNARMHRYPSDAQMFEAIEAAEPGPGMLRGGAGESLDVYAVTLYRGTFLCMPHLRMVRLEWK